MTGYRQTRGRAPGRELFFAMRFSRPAGGHAFHDTEQDVFYKGFATPADQDPARRVQIEGRQVVGSFDFGDAVGELVAKVAISAVSEAGAIANLDAEVPGFDFDRVRAGAREQWKQALLAIEIDVSEADRTAAYTALYHALQAPSLFVDVDGR